MRARLGLRQLESILAVAEFSSFSAAAAYLHVSQPALSRTVRLAEESLGARIFDRDTRSVSLTPAGAELVPIARRIVLEFGDSMSELSQFMEGRRGRVRVSAIPSMAQSLLIESIASFDQSQPDIEFQLRVDSADKILELIETRDIDVGLTVQPPPDGRFSYRHLYDDEFVLICRSDDPLVSASGGEQRLPWSVIEGRRFIATTSGSNTRTATDTAFMRAGIVVRPSHEVATSNLPFIGGLVAAGLGISVVPASTLSCMAHFNLAARRLMKPTMKRQVGMVTLNGRTLSVATERFCEHLVQCSGAVELGIVAGSVVPERRPRVRAISTDQSNAFVESEL